MRLGVFTFFNASGIGPVDLAVALETRGFGSLFVAEHSHIPVDAKTPYPMGGPIPPQYYRTLDPFVSLTAAAVATESLLAGYRHLIGHPTRPDPDGQRGRLAGSGVAGTLPLRCRAWAGCARRSPTTVSIRGCVVGSWTSGCAP